MFPIRVVERGEPGYPARLEALSAPPARVWLRGAEVSAPAVAVVGSRRASEEGRRLAEQLAFDAARAGISVVSGGALGIDAAAHRGAVRAGGHSTVVLPTPLDAPGPASNRRLFDELLEAGGTWLSELAHFRGRGDFSARNRLIAALADWVVVVEARASSGTRHTVLAAQRLGRGMAAVPWAVSDPRGEGGLPLLVEGARVITSGADLCRLFGRTPAPPPLALEPVGGLEGRLLELTRRAPAAAEELALAAGAEVAAVLVALTRLELEGRVAAAPGGRFTAASR